MSQEKEMESDVNVVKDEMVSDHQIVPSSVKVGGGLRTWLFNRRLRLDGLCGGESILQMWEEVYKYFDKYWVDLGEAESSDPGEREGK